jgi:hypothetical protein
MQGRDDSAAWKMFRIRLTTCKRVKLHYTSENPSSPTGKGTTMQVGVPVQVDAAPWKMFRSRHTTCTRVNLSSPNGKGRTMQGGVPMKEYSAAWKMFRIRHTTCTRVKLQYTKGKKIIFPLRKTAGSAGRAHV